MDAPRATPVGRYFTLSLLFVLAVVYQVRYTVFRMPDWFGKQVVQYPFSVVPGSQRPRFLAYTFRNAPIPGLQDEDQILAVNGKPMTGTAVFGEAIAHSRPGDSLRVTVRHENGTFQTVTVPLRAESSQGISSLGFWLRLFLFVVFPWFCLAIGFWVAYVRIRDIRAWLLLAVMLSFAGYFSPQAESWEPWLRDFAMAYHRVLTDFLPFGLLLLGLYFPEPFPSRSGWRRATWLIWIIAVPLTLGTVADVLRFVGGMENYAALFSVVRLIHPFLELLNPLALIGTVGMWVCLGIKFRLAISADTKRRLRVLVAGALVSLGPAVLLAVISIIMGSSIEQFFPEWVYLPAWVLFFLFPVTLAYVILVHRAMGVRLVLRQGLQYALAQRGVRILRVVLGIALGTTMYSLLQRVGPGVLYFVLLAAAIAIWIGIRRIIESFGRWVDRRFFREAYNAEQLLSELGETVRSIVEARPLLATVAERISQSLHVPQIAVLTNGSGPYRPAFALGFESVPPVTFPHDAATVSQLRQSREPARVYLDNPESWLYRTPGITEEERGRLAALHSEVLLPLSVKDKLLGFISLSSKRSEEPYSPADLRLLQSVAAQTGLALEVARLTTTVAEETARRERLSRELEIAREVQERLFPQQPPAIRGLDYCGACRPALGVGGDYYDFLLLADGQLGIALGDVSGKGIAAALMMASLQASLRAEASRGYQDLGPMIGEVNRLLYEASTQNRYATFFYAQYNPATRNLKYVNAGHNSPMLFKGCNSGCEPGRLDEGGAVIGLLPSFSYTDACVTLEPGDLLVLFTDGITETMNAADEEWGEASLIQTVARCKDLPSTEILARIMQAADGFAAGAPQHDDMTLVVLKMTK